MRTVEEALELLAHAAGAPRRTVVPVPLAASLGRILATDVVMDHDVPPFRRAAMDGFAVRAAEVAIGATFRITQAVMAGDDPHVPVPAGEAARIMTGAPVPDGADAVVPVEWTTEENDTVTVQTLPREPGNVVPRGAHVQAGAVVAAAGTAILPATLGALASAGCAEVPVARRPRVAILGTGAELVPVEQAPGPGAIRNSNSATLVGQCLRVGVEPVDLGIATDEVEPLRASIRAGLAHDVLLLSGGVSMGDKDLVPAALEAEGVRCVFHRWGVQPGGPLWCGVKGDTLVFGLPGNPAATFVGFEVLVIPALRTRLGLPFAPRRTLHARYEGPWGKPGPRRRFRPVTLAADAHGALVATAAPWRGSGDPFGLAGGDALAVLTEGLEAPSEGLVPVLLTGESRLLWGACA